MILCLETATTNCSVALFDQGQCLSYKENATEGYSHNEQLHEFIEEVMAMAGVELQTLDAIAVSKGQVLTRDCVLGSLQQRACVTHYPFR